MKAIKLFGSASLLVGAALSLAACGKIIKMQLKLLRSFQNKLLKRQLKKVAL